MRVAEPGPIYTIGHSTLPRDEFIAVLRGHGIGLLVDIRTVPRSRTNPQYNQDVLPAALAEAGIGYAHLARLGGLRGRRKDLPVGESPNGAWRNDSFRNYADYALTPAFAAGLDELIALATGPSAIMCAEAVWWRCHRRIVADYLLVRGVPVLDLIPPAPPEAHTLTPFARVQPDGTILYPPMEEAADGSA
jgi:uncharacterized protein (DUF488 family)